MWKSNNTHKNTSGKTLIRIKSKAGREINQSFNFWGRIKAGQSDPEPAGPDLLIEAPWNSSFEWI